MTIRRDVDRLAADGLLFKTLRGARHAESGSSLLETDLRARLAAHLPEKRAIAAAAATRIQAGQTVFLDGSTTSLELAKVLSRRVQGLTVVSNSALICLRLGQAGTRNSIICLGGLYDPVSASMHGPDTEATLSRLYVDVAFLSTKGFLPEEGTFESAAHLFRLKQIAVGRAHNVILLVDHSKFGQRAVAKVLDTAQIHTIITDAKAPAAAVAMLRRKGCEVVLAGGGGQDGKTRRLRKASKPATGTR
jgi:DeoR/GlpR family transcriptional regulator of sugar metabolism